MEYDLDNRYHVFTTNNWNNCGLIINNLNTGEILVATCNEIDKHGYSKLVLNITSSLCNRIAFTFNLVREDNIKGIAFNVHIYDHMPIPILCIIHDNYSEEVEPDLNMKVNHVYFDQFLYDFSVHQRNNPEDMLLDDYFS